MKYFLLNILLAGWVFFDAKKRLNSKFGWSAGTFFIGFLFLPIYLARRNLKQGEVREGGTAWIVAKNMALWWTVTMLGLIVVGWFSAIIGISNRQNNYLVTSEDAGAEALGTSIGSAILVGIWFVVTIVIVAFGFMFKNRTVENGPTGALAQAGTEPKPTNVTA